MTRNIQLLSWLYKYDQMISSILVLIPEIHVNKLYVNCLWEFFSFKKWTQWKHSQNNSTFLPRVLFAKDTHRSNLRLQDILRFFSFHISKLMHRYYFILGQDQFCLNLVFWFSIDILRFLAIYFVLYIQILSQIHEEIFG